MAKACITLTLLFVIESPWLVDLADNKNYHAVDLPDIDEEDNIRNISDEFFFHFRLKLVKRSFLPHKHHQSAEKR